MELGAATRPRSSVRGRRGPRGHQGAAIALRLRRIALVTALVALIPITFSYVHTISEPSNSSLGVRTVEWLRDHGAAGLVAKIESTYYALTAPSKGGPTLRSLPRVGYGNVGTATGTHESRSSSSVAGQST